MSLKNFSLLLIFFINLYTINAQIVVCTYSDNISYGYTCSITIYNPTGLNNITRIGGSHLAGKSNDDVRYIVRRTDSNTTNVPSIICDSFQNATRIALPEIGISHIFENSFDNCRSLEYMDLSGNLINDLPGNIFKSLVNLDTLILRSNKIKAPKKAWFESLEKLKMLYLYDNQIDDLPSNVFSSLKQITRIDLYNNNLKVIHSNSFGILPNLSTVYIYNNQIDAIDEYFIDNTRVQRLDMRNNTCVDQNIYDTSLSRLQMRLILLKCFDNYDNLIPETTTSNPTKLPPVCIEGKLDERVCQLEDMSEEFRTDLKNQGMIVADIQAENQKHIAVTQELQQNVLNLSKEFAAAIEELENKINELANRPCACQQNKSPII